LAALPAQLALLAGHPPTDQRRAAAVGTSALWMPGPEMFVAGWAAFVVRHGQALAPSEGAPRTRLLRLAARLLAAGALGKGVDPAAGDSEPKDPDWDPERVARHLERAAAQAYLLYRRARWLRLFFDSDVIYREPGSTSLRRLTLRAGQLIAANEDGAAPADGPPLSSTGRFDRATYDRLRVLTTELRRIMRDGGHVSMRPRR
jgi:hypothetical protein